MFLSDRSTRFFKQTKKNPSPSDVQTSTFIDRARRPFQQVPRMSVAAFSAMASAKGKVSSAKASNDRPKILTQHCIYEQRIPCVSLANDKEEENRVTKDSREKKHAVVRWKGQRPSRSPSHTRPTMDSRHLRPRAEASPSFPPGGIYPRPTHQLRSQPDKQSKRKRALSHHSPFHPVLPLGLGLHKAARGEVAATLRTY